MVLAGLAIGSVVILGRNHDIPFGYFSHPPIYGSWQPVLTKFALFAAGAGLLLAAVGWLVTQRRRTPTWLALAIVIAAGIALAAAIGMVRGDFSHLIQGVSTDPDSPHYTSDLHYVYELGVRGFTERHPEVTDFSYWNSRTHPPGVIVLLYGLFELFGGSHPLRITTAIAALGLCAAIPAWSMGRTMGDERSGRIAAVLLVAAPGPLLLAYTSMDSVFATALAAAAALFMIAIHRSSAAWAAAAGAALGVGTYLTYATVFIGLAAAIAVLLQARGVRSMLRLWGAAAAGGLATLLLARLLLGFDLLASYSTVPGAARAYDPYWIAGAPTAVLIFAGLPLAGLGVAGLFCKTSDGRRPVLPMVLLTIMLIWFALPSDITHLRPGEVERTWAFTYPVLAACAGPVVARWTRGAGRWSGVIIGGLVCLSVAQAILIQALWDTKF